MRSLPVALFGLCVCANLIAAGGVEPPPGAEAPRGSADPTLPFRRPGELTARCGALTVKDLGATPSVEDQMEGKGPEFVNLPPGRSINRRGQAIAVLAVTPPEGVTRDGDDGLVQVVVKGRPATGVINDNGDVLGQVIAEVTENGGTKVRIRAFFLGAEAKTPAFIETPPGTYLQISGLNNQGVGCGNLQRLSSDPSLPEDRPVLIVADPGTGRHVIKTLIERSKVPEKLTAWTGWWVNESGDVALNLQRPTGQMYSGMFKGKDGNMQTTCPAFIATVSQCAIVHNGDATLVPVPEDRTSMNPCALTDGGELVGMCEWREGKARFLDAGVWKAGAFKRFKVFPHHGVVQPCDADGGLACGMMTLSEQSLTGADKRAQADAGLLRNNGVLWSLNTGAFVTLDSLLPADASCTHISIAKAMRGDKVLCEGVIAGKPHAVIVTLPENVANAFSE